MCIKLRTVISTDQVTRQFDCIKAVLQLCTLHILHRSRSQILYKTGFGVIIVVNSGQAILNLFLRR